MRRLLPQAPPSTISHCSLSRTFRWGVASPLLHASGARHPPCNPPSEPPLLYSGLSRRRGVSPTFHGAKPVRASRPPRSAVGPGAATIVGVALPLATFPFCKRRTKYFVSFRFCILLLRQERTACLSDCGSDRPRRLLSDYLLPGGGWAFRLGLIHFCRASHWVCDDCVARYQRAADAVEAATRLGPLQGFGRIFSIPGHFRPRQQRPPRRRRRPLRPVRRRSAHEKGKVRRTGRQELLE